MTEHSSQILDVCKGVETLLKEEQVADEGMVNMRDLSRFLKVYGEEDKNLQRAFDICHLERVQDPQRKAKAVEIME